MATRRLLLASLGALLLIGCSQHDDTTSSNGSAVTLGKLNGACGDPTSFINDVYAIGTGNYDLCEDGLKCVSGICLANPPETCTVQGTVLYQDGLGAPGLTVELMSTSQLEDAAPWTYDGVTDADGTFTVTPVACDMRNLRIILPADGPGSGSGTGTLVFPSDGRDYPIDTSAEQSQTIQLDL